MYLGYFNQISNVKLIYNIDVDGVRKWFTSESKESIIREHYYQTHSNKKKKNSYLDHFFIMKNNILINLFGNSAFIIFEPSLENEAQELQHQLLQFIIKKKKLLGLA